MHDIKHKCGVFGVFGIDEAAVLTTLGLHALQHRGQEGAGIVSYDGDRFHSVKKEGLVGDNFNNAETLQKLPGRQAVGHVRYSTTGESSIENIQPLFANLAAGGFACAHNGNLTNTISLRTELVETGSIFQTTSDTEVVLQLVARSHERKIVKKLQDTLTKIKGAYSFIVMTNKKMIGIRDPFGIRPLVLGKKDDGYVFASETCALDIIGATYVRDVKNGEMVVVSERGVESFQLFSDFNERQCIFERIYFARPDSVIDGQTVYTYRKNLGKELAREYNIDADVVVPIPDSSVPAALGFSHVSGIPFELGIIRNNYIGRTFIEPSQSIRQFGVKLKHSVNRSSIEGKRVVLIDDSLVRGTTANKVVRMIFEAGAKEVHLGISSPEIKHPDFYGIDTPDYRELLASNHSVQEMTEIVGATSLFFLSLEGTYKAMGLESRNSAVPQFTDHCFTGDYPVAVDELMNMEIIKK
ncbi:MAG: amidophosphoribosyltransferase [Candidatus Margulisiibacteriota bacterium]|nr:amidophosphoribosyltransferase [Candidatus Margulisiibacteriota bacterium]